MKLPTLALAFTLSAASAFAADGQQTASEHRADMVEKAERAVVTIELENKDLAVFGRASGFIYNAGAGYILTNAHVVNNRDISVIKIVLSDDTRLDARIVGFDPLSDIGVVQLLEPDPRMPQVTLGDSDTVRKGIDVLTIGTPHDFNGSVAKGIVSGLHRQIDDRLCSDYIQSDAAINNGSSGGPLLDENDNVIGINSDVISPNGAFAGMTFSIPINKAVEMADKIVTEGKIRRGWLGASMADVDDAAAKKFNLDAARGGVMLARPSLGMPADNAGLKDGDVIMTLNGRPARDRHALACAISRLPPGGRAEISYMRGNQMHEASVILDEMPDPAAPDMPPIPRPSLLPH